jgi:hypothetical protein
MDQKRQMVFDEALAQIDAIIEDETPFQHSQEDHSHLVDILETIAYLENAIDSVANESIKEGTSKTYIIRKIENLEAEAYHTSIDLRLTQELFDRIKEIQSALSRIAREINDE